MKKLIFLSILIFSVFSNADVKEQALGKMEGYPNNCDYLKGNYTKCQIAWSSANDAPNSPMVRRFIKKGDATRELIVEPNKLGSFQKTTLDNLVKNSPILSLLVLKDGKLVYEKYQYDRKPTDTLLYFSMTKTITSLAVGKAVELGYIKSVDDAASVYVPELLNTPYGSITIKNILQMTSGVPADAGYTHKSDNAKNLIYISAGYDDSQNVTDFLKSYKITRKPDEQGKFFKYDNNLSALLGVILQNATKKPFNDFFGENLWSQFGTEADASIQGNKKGDVMTFGGFHSTPRDLARLGLLILDDGKYNDKQIISKSWLDTMTAPLVKGEVAAPYYGYQTWVLDSKGSQFALKGDLGQTMMIDRKTKTIFITFSVDEKNEYWEDLHKAFAVVSN
jgi:CubicO group peptidase (beta-lactamase class C family)